LKAALGLPIKVISGYKGTAEIRLAMESGELNGICGNWAIYKPIWRKALEIGDVVVVLQAVPKPLPDLPNIPLAINLAKTDEARQLIEVGIHNNDVYARPFVLPPGTPKEAVQILRKAFQETMKDKEFLIEMEKAAFKVNPASVENVEEIIVKIFKLDPAMLAVLKETLYNKW
jgi:tripartite-type tricarboxylate transporter receptor subunit TctC